MLRINTVQTSSATTLVVLGKLYDPWVSELNKVWQEAVLNLGARQLIVDLKETTAIDRSGTRLLAEMCDAGAKLLTHGVLVQFIIDSYRKRRTA